MATQTKQPANAGKKKSFFRYGRNNQKANQGTGASFSPGEEFYPGLGATEQQNRKPAPQKNAVTGQNQPKQQPKKKNQQQSGNQQPKAASRSTTERSKGAQPARQNRSKTAAQTAQDASQQRARSKGALRIISLGGLNEIGKNMTVYEYENEMIIVDCGMGFPDEDMLGIDLVIPDITYLIKNKEKVRGIFLTHGHEDHIGSLPYVLKDLNVPVYGTPMTLGLLRRKLEEHHLDKKARLQLMHEGDVVKVGSFEVEAIHVNHSIVGAVAFSIRTPVGVVVHTGDFKIDSTPIRGGPINLPRLGQLGNEGVLALVMDSTNAERPGYTMSERKVGESFNNLFRGCEKRIIVATFSSNVDRVQQIITAAKNCGRKVAISGRSMENMVAVAQELGYLDISDVLVNIDQIDRYPPNKIAIITTGSQGEPMSALYRMAYSDHRKVEIGPDDMVIISASPIPGNETPINKMINELYKKGAQIVHEALHEVHVSGHACQEELKMMMAATRPTYFIPVHGEYRHLYHARLLARAMGIPDERVFLSDIGRVIEIDQKGCRFNGNVPAGRVLVDGLGVGDVGSIVLRDRMLLSQDGLIVVAVTLNSKTGQLAAGPDVVSRGFVYVRESEQLIEGLKERSRQAVEQCNARHITDWASIKNAIKTTVGDSIFEQTKRRPVVLPIIMEA